MKRLFLLLSPILILFFGSDGFCQQGCDFDIVGNWKLASPDARPAFVSFSSNGTFVIRSDIRPGAGAREIAAGAYKLDFPKSPRAMQLTPSKTGGFLPEGTTSMEIRVSDDSSFTSTGFGAGSMRWDRVETIRHFLILAGREGNWREGGPAFAMLVKKDGRQTLIETVGLYIENHRKRFGLVPEDVYKEFLKEPHSTSDVMLRLEISAAEFERSLKIMQDWERRAREHTLPYPPAAVRALNVDASVLLKEMAESLNRCTQTINLYDLTWRSDDEVAVNYNPRQVPFQYIKRLRQLNEKRHVLDRDFAAAGAPTNTAPER